MKREIKFRAWDKDNECMQDSLDGFRGYFVGNSIEILYLEQVFREGGGEIYTENKWVVANLELMQYTGLKDKNGKEIYEGDILEQWFMPPRLVEWRGTAFIIDDGTSGVHNLDEYDPKDIKIIC